MRWKDKVTKSFDRKAHQYGQHNQVQCHIAEELVSLAPSHKNAKILEIGCGDGTLTKMLANKFPDNQILATDISLAMLETAQKNLINLPNVQFQQMDGEELKLGDTYDLIISNMTVQWFQNLPETIAQWQKHLKASGQIIVSRPGDQSFIEWKTALKSLDLPEGMLPVCPPLQLVKTIQIHQQYENTWQFLKSMQNAGAVTARPDYKPLSVADIKKACAVCDQQSNAKITWHIYIETIKAGNAP